jgi:cytochrome c-type biogenesis protein CcmE
LEFANCRLPIACCHLPIACCQLSIVELIFLKSNIALPSLFWAIFAVQNRIMKKTHIILLVLIIGAIAALISMMPKGGTDMLSSYETIEGAKEKSGKYVHVVAKLDKTQPIDYDAIKNPNYLSFTAIDTTGRSVKVVYNNAKPDNLEHSEKLVMKGKMNGDVFECNEIMMKCPSKYTDDPTRIQESLNKNTN